MKQVKWKQRLAKAAVLCAMAGSIIVPFSVGTVKTEVKAKGTVAASVSENVTKKITKKNSDITMEVSCGIDGVVVYDSPVQILITVKSSKDFTGYIQVTPKENYGENVVAYGEDISLAAGTSKTFSFVVSDLNNEGRFSIALLNEKDKVIYSESDTVTIEGTGDSVYMGVMSDDFSGLSYFDAAPVDYAGYEQEVNLLELSKDNFPEDSSAIGMMSYLLIDNYDTAKLSDKQYEALKDWVNEGGVLLVALGPNYQNVLHCFQDDFLTGTLGTVKKENLSWNIDMSSLDDDSAESAEQSIEDGQVDDADGNEVDDSQLDEANENKANDSQPEKEHDSSKITLNDVDVIPFSLDGGKPFDSFSEDETAYKKDCGTGVVVVLSYDLGMEPFTSLSERREVVIHLLKEAAGGLTINRMSGNMNTYSYFNSQDIAKGMNEARRPSTLLFGVVLIAYVIFVGPILYLILKKRNKREKIWIAIPVTAMVCTFFIYLLSTMYRVRKPILNTFTVMQLADNSKEEKVYSNVVCPKAKDYSFNLGGGYGNVLTREDYNYSMFGTPTREENDTYYDMLVKKENDGVELRIHNDSAFQEKNFTISRISENEIGSIELALHCYTTGFGGVVTNNTNCDLNNVVVNFEDHFYVIDSLKKGESAEIDEKKLIQAQTYDTFSNYGNLFAASNWDKKERRYQEINQFMENKYVQKNTYNQGCVWADVGTYIPEMVTDDSVKQYGGAVVYQPFVGTYEDVSATYCPDLSTVLIASDGEYDSTDRCIYSGVVTATYSLEDYEGITTLVNLDHDKKPVNGYGEYAAVYAYNAQTGDYEAIFTNSDTITGEELKKYVAGNILILRYEGGSDGGTYIPKICAKGDE